MTEEKRRFRYWLVGQDWNEGWFLLSLLAGLLLGIPGLLGAASAYTGLRAVGARLPRLLAAAAALALAVAAVIASETLLGRR